MANFAVQPPRLPFNGPLFGFSQFLVVVSMIPGFLPRFIRIPIIFFVGWISYRAVFTQTTGDMGGDLGLGSSIITQFLIALDFGLITSPHDIKNFHENNSKPLTERSFKERALWAWGLYANPRAVGWSFEPLHLPGRAPASTPKWKFVASRIFRVVLCVFLECVVYVIDASNPGMTTPGKVLTEAPIHWRALGVACFAFAGACRITALHSVLAAVVVGFGFSSPERWPDLFGTPRDAWSVQRLWRRVWHQMLRRPVLSCTDALLKPLRLSSTSNSGKLLFKFARLYVAFFIIAAAHMGGDKMLTGHLGFGAFTFFMLQPFGITFELAVCYLWTSLFRKTPPKASGPNKSAGANGSANGNGNVGPKGYIAPPLKDIGAEEVPALWVRAVGYAWVAIWSVYTVAYMVDPMCSVGMFADERWDLRKKSL